MRKTRILFLITKATHGGAQKYVRDLATNLSKVEFEPIIAYGQSGKLSNDLAAVGIETRKVGSLDRDVAIFSDIVSFFEIWKTIRQIKPDVIHLNSSKAAALGALAARFAGVKKIIFTVHGWPFKEDRGFIARKLIYFISWFTALLSHATIVVSKTDEKIGRHMPFANRKIHYVSLGIEILTFLSREAAADSLAITTDAPRIVTIGELTKNKGYHNAIDAIAELKDRHIPCMYYIIGDGELREELEEYVLEKEVENHVVFCGFIENASRLLKAFDVFVLPSLKEGTPYVLLEAEIAGLPIVATNAIDAFWTESGIVTVVPAASTSLLAQAIERAIEQPIDGTVQPFSTLDKMLKETIDLY